jgi:ribose transport system substrate-binding protein
MNRILKIVLPLVILAAAVLVISQTRVLRLIGRHGHESVYVVMKTTGTNMEFWQVVRAGMSAAATEYDVQPRIVGPELEKDVGKQIQILSRVIQRKPDGILLVAGDYNRLVPLAKKAAAEGVTIVTMDSALNSTVPVSFIATDNVAAGQKAGMEIARLVPANREIAIVSHIRGVATAIDREKGVRDALAKAGRQAPVGTFFAENDLKKAYRIVTELVRTHPDLGGIVALNESSTVGAGRALRDLGAAGKIKLVGFDNSEEEAQFLESGVVQALIVQKPFNMGYLGIRTLVEAMRGHSVPRLIRTASVLVRRNDMFTPENQKLLFPILQKQH